EATQRVARKGPGIQEQGCYSSSFVRHRGSGDYSWRVSLCVGIERLADRILSAHHDEGRYADGCAAFTDGVRLDEIPPALNSFVGGADDHSRGGQLCSGKGSFRAPGH